MAARSTGAARAEMLLRLLSEDLLTTVC
jgi:hypothetical protein